MNYKQNLTVPRLIWAVYIFWVVVLVFALTRPVKYDMNGYMPESNYIHSEIKP